MNPSNILQASINVANAKDIKADQDIDDSHSESAGGTVSQIGFIIGFVDS